MMYMYSMCHYCPNQVLLDYIITSCMCEVFDLKHDVVQVPVYQLTFHPAQLNLLNCIYCMYNTSSTALSNPLVYKLHRLE